MGESSRIWAGGVRGCAGSVGGAHSGAVPFSGVGQNALVGVLRYAREVKV